MILGEKVPRGLLCMVNRNLNEWKNPPTIIATFSLFKNEINFCDWLAVNTFRIVVVAKPVKFDFNGWRAVRSILVAQQP